MDGRGDKTFRPAVLWFVLGAVVLLPLALAVQLWAAAPNAFGSGADDTARRHLTHLPTLFLTRAKMRAAADRGDLQVGVFGNSRSMMIESSSLGLPADRFFNYSISGQSFRNSTAFVRWLADEGKLPNTVVISLDNLQLELFGNPSILDAGVRLSVLTEDVHHMAVKGQPVRRIARAVWRHVWIAWQDLQMVFSGTAAWRNLGYLTGREETENGPRRRFFRADGSIPTPSRPDGVGPAWAEPASRQIDAVLLQRDIQTLGKVRAETGVTIIVYESPLYPDVVKPTPEREAVRSRFLEACSKAAIVCRPAPTFAEDTGPLRWPDASHPAAPAIGRWLVGVLSELPAR